MKPKEKKPSRVFRIINKENGKAEGVYSRAYCNEYDFESPSDARNSHCYGIFKDELKYDIAEYEVTYTLIKETA